MTDKTTILYNLSFKQKEQIKIQLPSLRYQNKFLTEFKLVGEVRTFDVKLVANDHSIASYGEASLSLFSLFSLNQYSSDILNAENISLCITNINKSKEYINKLIPLTLEFIYEELPISNAKIIYENMYYSSEKDTLNIIIDDIKKYCKRAQRLIFTNITKLTLTPQFNLLNCEPFISKIEATSNSNGYIELIVPEYFYENINYYNLNVEFKNNDDDNLKFGLIIYGH